MKIVAFEIFSEKYCTFSVKCMRNANHVQDAALDNYKLMITREASKLSRTTNKLLNKLFD